MAAREATAFLRPCSFGNWIYVDFNFLWCVKKYCAGKPENLQVILPVGKSSRSCARDLPVVQAPFVQVIVFVTPLFGFLYNSFCKYRGLNFIRRFLPHSADTSVRPNGIADPIASPVIMLPSLTTPSRTMVAPIRSSSKPG